MPRYCKRRPNVILFSEVADGHQPMGAPKICFSDSIKKTMPLINILPVNWEYVEEDRKYWMRLCVDGAITADFVPYQQAEEKRTRRKVRARQRLLRKLPSLQLRCRFCERKFISTLECRTMKNGRISKNDK